MDTNTLDKLIQAHTEFLKLTTEELRRSNGHAPVQVTLRMPPVQAQLPLSTPAPKPDDAPVEVPEPATDWSKMTVVDVVLLEAPGVTTSTVGWVGWVSAIHVKRAKSHARTKTRTDEQARSAVGNVLAKFGLRRKVKVERVKNRFRLERHS